MSYPGAVKNEQATHVVRRSTPVLALAICLALGQQSWNGSCAAADLPTIAQAPTDKGSGGGRSAQAEAGDQSNAAGQWQADYASGLAAESDQQPTKAEGLFRKALNEMQKQPHQPVDEENCMRKLGDALLLRGKTLEAQAEFQKLLNLKEKRYGANSPKVEPVLIVLGSIQESLGDHAAAMVLYQRALKLNEKSYGPYSPQFADSLHKLGRASYKAGHRDAAGKEYKKALGILSNQPGLEASGELKALLKDYNDLIKNDDDSNRDLVTDFDKEILPKPAAGTPPTPAQPDKIDAGISSWQKQNSFSLKAQTQASLNEDPLVALRGLTEPGSNQNLAPVFKTMSDTIFRQSHFEKGEDYYKRKIAIDVQALGPDHPSVANDLCGLAVFYMSRQNYAEAKPLLTRALPIYQRAWGDDNPLSQNTLISLASADFHLGDTAGATTLYRQALSHGQSTPNSLETARVLNDIAYLNFHQGKLAEACTFYEWALASTEGAVGQKDPLLAACLHDYALVLRGLGRTAEASAVETRADGIIARTQ